MAPAARRCRTKRSRARFNSLASVGNITAFGCTVVSTTTRAKSLGFIASVRVATDKLSWMSAVSFASPIRCRHRVSDERSNGLAAHVGVELRQSYAAGLLSLPRPHRSPSLDHLEGKESQPPIRGIAKTICKKTAVPPPNSGKSHCLERLNHPSRSTPWKYFTGDCVKWLARLRGDTVAT